MCKVSIDQFYGIEINGFAVMIAKTVLWIAEKQWNTSRERSTHATIVEGNALRLDWESIVPKNELSYIMGNPPFVGYSLQTREQKADILLTYVDENGKPYKTAGKIDYVAGWYFKATQFMTDTNIRTAFVSTNSITQGESVANLWKPLFESGIHIDFAYRTFRWDSESNSKAHVHCVIIGFSIAPNSKDKIIYTSDRAQIVKNINGYLVDADDVFIESRIEPLSEIPTICLGGQPIDDGNLVLTEKEKDELLEVEPQAQPLLRFYMMGKDFINRKPRYCLWLKSANPSLLKKCPLVMERIKKVKEFRQASARTNTLRAAETPTLFVAPFECATSYIAIPKVSSGNRRYIPIDFLTKDIIPGDKLFVLQSIMLYYFGILASNVHMAWVRTVAGRFGTSYSYSNTIVYNNFPWPSPSDEQRKKIEQTAQAILDARALYPDSSLAELYKESTMPPELRKAHLSNDCAVMEAYGFDITMAESVFVAELMKMYKKLTEK